MPIPVLTRVAPPVKAPALPVPPLPVKWGRTSVSVIGSNGQGEELSLTSFSDRGWPTVIMQPGATGLDMPPYALFSDESPNLDGSIFRNARAAAREIMIPVYLYGIDRQTINQLKRKLFQLFNPKRGYCVLRFTEGDGISRNLSCYYKGGMEGAEGTDTAGFTWAKYGLTFTAMDPWFYPERDESVRWSFGTGEPLVSPSKPFFPMSLTNGVVGGDGQGLAIYNPGDVEAWPVWVLQGPIRSFSLVGPYGASVAAPVPADNSDLVPAGRTLTIDTRPGRKTVRDDLGTNYWASLSASPQFWSVEPGETFANVSVVTGSGMAAVTLSFTPRYASYV